ncbi:MAG: acetate--CoA ligase family protein [Candidatus Tectomicrobia bacterium]|uniref:Acetate--CoA ligase family protein n=1 Tax=Tectimicrobiota bacterium TaxID=2528274 RepID=A0A932HVH2_UNCTE|nr:acetate--CoA ligase family protein [Candidatus Tectomicrobia bacterium]
MSDPSATRQSLRRLLAPASVAVVGASADLERFNGRVLKNLLRHGYPGRVYPVNPKYSEVAGVPCWPSLDVLPETPETVFIAVGREHVLGVVEECAARGVAAVTIYTAGFSETGGEGARLERGILARARASGMRVCGPNAAGYHNFHARLHLAGIIALEIDGVLPGAVGVVCQSGSIGGALLSRATRRGIGFSYMISCGNEMDLEAADYVDFLVEDRETRAIALYLEGLRDGPKFLRAAERALAAGKPIAALKVGRAEAGRAAAVSHTGALAGEDFACDAAFRHWGVTRVEGLEALFETAHMFASTPLPRGRRVGIVSTTGGGGALVADACGALGLEVPPPGERLEARLREALPGAAPAANPMDTTIAGIQAFGAVLRAALEEGPFDLAIPVVGSSAQFRPEIGVAPILKAKEENWGGGRPLLAYFNPQADEAHRLMAGAGIASFQSAEGCARAAAHLAAYADHPARRRGRAPVPPVPAGARPFLQKAGPLGEGESLSLAEMFGIRAVPRRLCRDGEEAVRAGRELGYPVVLKLSSPDVPHKTEAGLVSGRLADEAALRAAHAAMAERLRRLPGLRREGFLVERWIEGGAEFLLGTVWDAQFGPVVTVGLGGLAAEALGDVSARLAPLAREDAEAMLGELRGARVLGAFRGRGALDRGALAEAIVALGTLAAALGGRLREADINPLFVLPEGEGCLAADALIVLGGGPGQPG